MMLEQWCNRTLQGLLGLERDFVYREAFIKYTPISSSVIPAKMCLIRANSCTMLMKLDYREKPFDVVVQPSMTWSSTIASN